MILFKYDVLLQSVRHKPPSRKMDKEHEHYWWRNVKDQETYFTIFDHTEWQILAYDNHNDRNSALSSIFHYSDEKPQHPMLGKRQ